MLKPATAIRNFLSTDCCNTGRNYPRVAVKEIQELKESCSQEEYEQMGKDAAEHLAAHDTEAE